MTSRRTVPPWALFAAALALVVPAGLAFVLAGPAAGLVVGLALVAAVVLAAARHGRRARIEVAPLAPHRRSSLVLLSADPDGSGATDELATRSRSRPDGVMLLAPVPAGPLERWLSATDDARAAAEQRRERWQGALASRGLAVRGQVGDSEAPLDQAVEDALRTFPAEELVVITARDADRTARDLRSRLDIPVISIVTGAPERRRPVPPPPA